MSLRDAASASGGSHTQLWRFERGELDRLSIEEIGAWCAVVGLDLALRAYPAGDPIRDRAQLALLERFRGRLHPSLLWRTEVPLPIAGDPRAWDAEIRGDEPRPWRARVEGETHVADGQMLERRVSLKQRDDPFGHVILLLSDTRSNRAALHLLRNGLRSHFPLDTRPILSALRVGSDPGGSGIVIL